jgi:cellulose synthase/poly-beta-1,6-N-acetylglucosamine synthase-like glycosyltransferase
VNDRMPSVTVVIAARPGQAEVEAVPAARALDYPADKLEIILARGKQPSAQRNAAIKEAQGDLIYFLDDDSVPEPKNLRRIIGHFSDPDVKMVGGPNICPADAPPLEQKFALVLGSWALGPSRARYTPVGTVRQTSEKELILCNLVARREALLELGGFNEKLYPNEENALMDELQADGGKLLYDSQLIVRRRPRRTLKAFAKMLVTYGRGRAEQFRVNPTLGSALNFAPPLFLVYLLLLIPLMKWRGSIFLFPVIIYLVAVFVQALLLTRSGRTRQSFATIPLIILTHILYGFGFWRGLFTTLKPKAPAAAEVSLEKLSRDS